MYGKFYNVIIVSYVRPEGNSPVNLLYMLWAGFFYGQYDATRTNSA